MAGRETGPRDGSHPSDKERRAVAALGTGAAGPIGPDEVSMGSAIARARGGRGRTPGSLKLELAQA